VNLQDYISSGILEAYVLGDLSESEKAEVEKNLLLYPELRKELASIEEAQEVLLLKAGVTPPERIKASLLAKVSNEQAKVIDINSRQANNPWKYAAAAAITIALIASFLAFNYWSKWKNTSQQLTALIAQNQLVAQDYNQVNNRLDKLERDLEVMNNPQFKRIIMTGTPNAPEAIASVYWNESSNEVYLKVQNLKALASENQYQLWAIIDGKPVDAGIFDADKDGLIKMKGVSSGAALFAVTIEPRGGKPSPTLETMQVKGEVTKG
jgi:anti-sigma-K factor RskA